MNLEQHNLFLDGDLVDYSYEQPIKKCSLHQNLLPSEIRNYLAERHARNIYGAASEHGYFSSGIQDSHSVIFGNRANY
jgi:hypothetical protein